jgi:acyl carrier protein
MALNKAEVRDALRAYITTHVLGRDVALADDTPLIEGGHLTSLQTVELIGFIAETWGVEVEPEEVDETRFRSLDTIAELVSSKTA